MEFLKLTRKVKLWQQCTKKLLIFFLKTRFLVYLTKNFGPFHLVALHCFQGGNNVYVGEIFWWNIIWVMKTDVEMNLGSNSVLVILPCLKNNADWYFGFSPKSQMSSILLVQTHEILCLHTATLNVWDQIYPLGRLLLGSLGWWFY